MRPQLSSTLVEAAPPATRLSLSIMPKPRWENPELSVGTPHASLDLLGRYKCWSVKDGSPAHIVWKTVSKAITNLLEDQYEHLDAGGSELMVEMFMVGRKLTNSIPTILFSCESKTCRQKALVLVRKKGILTNHSGVLMAESSKLPRPLALDEQADAPCLSPGVYLNGPLRCFGTSILIYSDEGTPPRKATIGGIMTINHELYGGTAAHAFFPVKDEENTETEDLEFAFFGDEDPYDSDSGDDEDLVEMTSKASMSSRSSQSPGTDESGYSSLAYASSNSASVLEKSVIEAADNATIDMDVENTSVKVGELFASTEAGDRLDWALVKIQSPPLTLQFTRLYDSYNKIWGEQLRYPRSIRDATFDVRVLVFTGSEGVVEGSLSTVTSFSLNSNSHKFQPLLMVRRLAGKFSDGDCGSWVFDKETRDVYGHIVSGYPSTGTAYIVPSVQTFEDIQQRIGKPIGFFAHTSKESQDNTSGNSDSSIHGTEAHTLLYETDHPAPQTSTKASEISKNIKFLSSGKIKKIKKDIRKIRKGPACNRCRAAKVKCYPERSSCVTCIRSGRGLECSFQRARIVSTDDGGKQVSETEGSVSINWTKNAKSVVTEAENDGYASTPEGFTKDRPHAHEIPRTGSDDNTASSWTIPRSMQQLQMKYQPAKFRKLDIEAISDVNLSNKASPPLSIESEDDFDTEFVAAIGKRAYQRPKQRRVLCTLCDDEVWFRGANALARHVDRQHNDAEKSWICIEPEDGIKEQFKPVNDISNCRACRDGKKYSGMVNAVAHLRHIHFNPRIHFNPKASDRNQSSKMEGDPGKRDGERGGYWPPVAEIERWVKEVNEESSDEEPTGEDTRLTYDGDLSNLAGLNSIDPLNDMLMPIYDDSFTYPFSSNAIDSNSNNMTPFIHNEQFPYLDSPNDTTFYGDPFAPNAMFRSHSGVSTLATSDDTTFSRNQFAPMTNSSYLPSDVPSLDAPGSTFSMATVSTGSTSNYSRSITLTNQPSRGSKIRPASQPMSNTALFNAGLLMDDDAE
ncbi:hypothetical protein V492_03884 [Pseudogymnoascus sp. VKM F-4246]|nr:hypothetical protein V492_03884 [Pseudogymnoascus sp. VKM F-4246]